MKKKGKIILWVWVNVIFALLSVALVFKLWDLNTDFVADNMAENTDPDSAMYAAGIVGLVYSMLFAFTVIPTLGTAGLRLIVTLLIFRTFGSSQPKGGSRNVCMLAIVKILCVPFAFFQLKLYQSPAVKLICGLLMAVLILEIVLDFIFYKKLKEEKQ